jgi:phage terminase large subunit-like protein
MKLFNKAKRLQESGDTRWAAFHFTSLDNPYISQKALKDLTMDMSAIAYRMEIMAEDVDEAPGALWTRKTIDDNRVYEAPKELDRIVVAVDPSTTKRGDECGIVVCGKKGKQGYVLSDRSIQGSPLVWAKEAIKAYKDFEADRVIAESNQGGEMVEVTLNQVDKKVPVKLIHASRGKQTRAEPVSTLSEKGRIHHVGNYNKLEDELCLWIPGDDSPNRLDAMVHGMTELLVSVGQGFDWADYVGE